MGLWDGPSVQGLEDLYGPRWRQTHSENVLYGQRKLTIDEIRRRQAEGIKYSPLSKRTNLFHIRVAYTTLDTVRISARPSNQRVSWLSNRPEHVHC